MKIFQRILCTATLICVCSISAFSATYKVNSSGTMTSPTGTTQKVTKPVQGGGTKIQQPYYNTVQSGVYTSHVQKYVGQPDIVEIIMDYSGSMSSWVKEANRTMSAILAQIPSSIKAGMRVTGYQSINVVNNVTLSQTVKSGVYKVVTGGSSHPSMGYCRASQQLIQIGDSTANASQILSNVTLGGSTPLVYALSQTVQKDFSPYPSSLKKKIILITDGGENCHANPCAYAATLAATRPDIVVDVVLVGGSAGSQFRCFSELTGGTLYTPSQVYNFSNVILNSATNNTPSQPAQPVSQPQQNVQSYEYVE